MLTEFEAKYGKGGRNADESPYNIDNPHNLQADRQGNIYVAENGTNRIRKIDTTGNITTAIGDGNQGVIQTASIPRSRR